MSRISTGRLTCSSSELPGTRRNVVFEAMGNGLPSCQRYRRPGHVVDDTCGFRLHPQTPQQYGRDIADALARLVTEPEFRLRLGEGARQRVADIGLWSSRARQVEAISAQILARRRASVPPR